MRGWLRRKTRSVFARLLLLFSAMVVPLYAIGFITISYVSRGIVSEIQRTIDDNLYFHLSSVEKEISYINQLLVSLSVDNAISLYIGSDEDFDPIEYQTYNSIKSRLQTIYLSSRYINNVFVVFPDARESGYEIASNFAESHIGQVRTLISEYERFPHLYSAVGEETITYMTRSMDGSFVLGVEISQNRVFKSLKEIDSSYPFGFFLMDSITGRLLARSACSALDERLYDACRQAGVTNGTVRLDGVAYVVKLLPSSDGKFTLVTYISDKNLMYDLRIFRNIFFGFVVISATFLVIMAWMVKKTVHKPLATIVNSMKLVEQGDYSVAMRYERDDEFGYVYRRFNKMASQLQTLIEEVLMRKIQIQQSELSRLQSHINPHFLYNSLYIGYRMAKSGETEGVAKLCKYLGDYFRFITYFARNLIAFPDELKFTVTYLKIQKLRYEERLEFLVDAHDGEDPIRIPVLLIQPIVENSVLYGMKDRDDVLLIEIETERTPEAFTLTVRDNGPGMTEERLAEVCGRLECPEQPTEKGYGLWNIAWRLRYLYGGEGSLTLANRAGGGLAVVIRIPMTVKEEPDV